MSLFSKTLKDAADLIGDTPTSTRLREMAAVMDMPANLSGGVEARVKFQCACGCGTVALLAVNGHDVVGRTALEEA